MNRLESIILKNLIINEPYARKVLPFIKREYFVEEKERIIFERIENFIIKYNNIPTKEAVAIDLQNLDIPDERLMSEAFDVLELCTSDREIPSDEKWLLDSTEKFCQEKAIYNAVLEAITILDEKNKKNTKGKGAIPSILSDALAVGFDTNIGHDYLEDSDARFAGYHKKERKLPFDLDWFNKITNGGIPPKTLNLIMAGTGVGKTLGLCHLAAGYLASGFNVLYITLEMAEERIAERIDANLLNTPLDELKILPKETYDRRINKLKEKTPGKIIIKEYPTAGASVIHFRNLLNELSLKKNFRPDVIIIDYMNICASSRMKAASASDSYGYVKSIAEEIRGLGVEFNVPIWSATQSNRSGFADTDVDITKTSDSFGTPMTADFMVVLITSEELEKLGQLMVKQLKNRYNDATMNKRFIIGVDKSRMRLYNVENQAQNGLVDANHSTVASHDDVPWDVEEVPVFDRGKSLPKPKFEGLEV